MAYSKPRISVFVALSVLAMIGCESEGVVLPADRSFVIGQILITPDGFSSSAVFTSSLDAEALVDPGDSVELPGLSGVTPAPRPGTFFVGSGEAPEVFRYDVDRDGAITQNGPVSFAGRGAAITGNPPLIISVDESKAYYLDINQRLGFTFDPEALEITGEFPLTGLESPSPDFPVADFAGDPIRRGDQLFVSAAYRNLEEGTGAALSRILRLDVMTDEFAILDDARCPLTTRLVEGPDGYIYTGTDALHGAAFLARPDTSARPCLLRLLPDGSGFDEEFLVFYEDLVGTNGAGTLIRGFEGQAYFLAYDETIAPPAATQNEVAGTPAWRTYRMSLGDDLADSVVPIDEIPIRSTGGVSPGTVGEAYYDAVASADFSETTLYRTDATAMPEQGITFPGLLGGISDLRNRAGGSRE